MENSEKLTNNKQIIAYLVELFPKCFISDGEAKPLKIGIFQDLAARLEGDPKVSKTQLRAALRQYTSSWRYLHGAKPGAQRVGLDGSECGELETEHVEHAQKTLKESKAKVFANKKEEAKKGKEETVNRKPKQAVKRKPKPQVKVEYKPAKIGELKENQQVKVIVGKSPVAATIVEVGKEEVQVQLGTGMTLKVKAEHLIL